MTARIPVLCHGRAGSGKTPQRFRALREMLTAVIHTQAMLLRDARILVVDDHQPMRDILKSILFGFGVRHVDEAHDAAQAFEMLRLVNYDILLTDYDMEGETGVQLAH